MVATTLPCALVERSAFAVLVMARLEVVAPVAVKFVAKRLVEVAAVPVALRKVTFWRVEEPVTRRFESVERPPVAVRAPLRVVAPEIVKLPCPRIFPVVVAPPAMVRPPACVPLPIVEEAAAIMLCTVDVGERYAEAPVPKISHALPNDAPPVASSPSQSAAEPVI